MNKSHFIKIQGVMINANRLDGIRLNGCKITMYFQWPDRQQDFYFRDAGEAEKEFERIRKQIQ